MLKKSITYTDYAGKERKKDFYFNLSRLEVTEMEASAEGGLVKQIQKMIDTEDKKSIIVLIKDLILKAYGEKSVDDDRFIKKPELTEAFSQTEAFVELFMELANSGDAMAAFVNGIVPAAPPSKN